MKQTLVEKIVQRYVTDSGDAVHSGDYVSIRPRHVLTHDNTGAVIPKLKKIGKKRWPIRVSPFLRWTTTCRTKARKICRNT
ncbi:MAG: hypothetical protein U5N26_04665 [Candidatus Marinimicrobia bacterium]|nr:hypothetical protein [Candidatus Neomarinimicrobiota bacterium]